MFLDQLNPGNNWWYINVPLRMRGNVNIDALQQAFNDLRQRHEALRSTIPTFAQMLHTASVWFDLRRT